MQPAAFISTSWNRGQHVSPKCLFPFRITSQSQSKRSSNFYNFLNVAGQIIIWNRCLLFRCVSKYSSERKPLGGGGWGCGQQIIMRHKPLLALLIAWYNLHNLAIFMFLSKWCFSMKDFINKILVTWLLLQNYSLFRNRKLTSEHTINKHNILVWNF